MPIFWIIAISAVFFLAFRILEWQHGLNKERRPSTETPPKDTHDAATADTSKLTSEKETATDASPPPADKEVATDTSEPAADKEVKERPFLDTIPGLPNETKTELMRLDLTTPRAITDTADQELLALKGIGPARLKQLRAACTNANSQ